MNQVTAIAKTQQLIPIQDDPVDGPRRLIGAFLSRRSKATRRAYQADLDDFAAYVGFGTDGEAMAYLLSRGPGPANELAMNYKAALQARGLAAATVNRRLSTLRSAVKLARTVGACTFSLEVESEKAEAYRDTRGPSLDKVRAAIGTLESRADRGERRALRDLAIVRLLFNVGLRRGEVVSLDVEHYDPDGGRIFVQGKARTSREWVTLSPEAKIALERWLAARGDEPGAIFPPCDRLAPYRNDTKRLSATSVYRMLRHFGIRPHGLRHAAITEALRLTAGDIPQVMRFSRHKSPAVLMVYDDRRRDGGGKVAAMLDGVA